jgi:hypothetical protein
MVPNGLDAERQLLRTGLRQGTGRDLQKVAFGPKGMGKEIAGESVNVINIMIRNKCDKHYNTQLNVINIMIRNARDPFDKNT